MDKITKKNILKIIFKAIDELNPLLPKNKQLAKSIKTFLYGDSGVLDSLDLVSFIVSVEQNIQEELNTEITLANEKAISRKHSPFRYIGSLVDYIYSLLKENSNE